MKQLIDGYFVERGEKKIRTFYSDAKSKGVKLKDKNAYRDFIVQKINSFDVSDKLKNILSRMTAFADERYQSVDQVLADLRSDNVGPIMKPRDIYSEIEASYLKKAKKVTSTKSELLRAPQVEYLMDLHKEFENKVRSRLGDIVSKEELSNMMRFNEVDKNINDRYKSDTHYVSKEIREAENWWEKMKQQGQLVDEKRGPDGEILEQVWNVKTEAYENIENQRKKLVKKGKNFQPISKAWNKCYSIIEQYVR